MYFLLTARPEVRDLPGFIFGQSMGGAIALKAHLKQPNDWDGVILVAPMCKVCPFLSVALFSETLTQTSDTRY